MDDRVEDAGHGIGARALELALAEQGVQLPDAIVEKAGPRVEDLLGQAAEERVGTAQEARDEEAKRAMRCEDALRRIVNMEIPVGVGAECADWLKGVAREALREGEG